jgi:hypothetical protein
MIDRRNWGHLIALIRDYEYPLRTLSSILGVTGLYRFRHLPPSGSLGAELLGKAGAGKALVDVDVTDSTCHKP